MCCPDWCVKNRWAMQDKKMAPAAFLLLTSLWPFKVK
jgi:hypothetical protein